MRAYQLANFYISEAFATEQNVRFAPRVVISDSAVNFFLSSGDAFGINRGSSRVILRLDGVICKMKVASNDDNKITYAIRPAITDGFVQWSGDFNADDIIEALYGFSFSDRPDDVEFQISEEGKTIDVTGSWSTTVTWDDDNLYVDGTEVTETTEFQGDEDFKITIDPETTLAYLNKQTLSPSVDKTSLEGDTTNTFTEVNIPQSVFEEKELSCDYNTIEFDDYGHQYFKINALDAYTSTENIWLKNNSRQYLDRDQSAFVVVGDNFSILNRSDAKSLATTDFDHIKGLVSCSEAIFVSYAKVYRSYVYIDYSFVYFDEEVNRCGDPDAVPTIERACRLKVKNSSITMSKISDKLEQISLIDGAQDLSAAMYDKIRFGIGCFKSDYKIYTYKDLITSLEVIFNRESSSKYLKLTVEDQTTRYATAILTKSGSKESTKKRNIGRYTNTAEKKLSSSVVLNLTLKKSNDMITDDTETLFTNGAISLEKDTLMFLSKRLYVNILDVAKSFPRIRLSYSNLAVVAIIDEDGTEKEMQLDYITRQRVIVGKIEEDDSQVVLAGDDLLDFLNEINVKYVFEITCKPAVLKITDLDGNESRHTFTEATLLIIHSEIVDNSPLKKIFYTNTTDNGILEALSYTIEEEEE